MEMVIYIALVLFGLCLGSFAGATVWRLRARQLRQDKKVGEFVDAKEYARLKKLTKHSLTKDRSVCLHCGYELRWYDLIPLVSWLSLGGKCRQCRKRIGYLEPLIELGTALYFVASYAFWPFLLDSPIAIAGLVIWLIAGVVFAILFAYDAKWYLLPDSMNFLLIAVGIASVVQTALATGDVLPVTLNALAAVGIMAGIYFVLYVVSKGRWIGFGDIKLGVGLGLLLGDWTFALLALFLANLIGCLVIIPLMVAKKVKRTSTIPFGPLLIVGTIIAQLFGAAILGWYTTLTF